MKRLHLLCLIGVLAILPVGCAIYSNASYSEWSGPAVCTGTGGTKKTVEGIDIWQMGTPPCPYQVLGVINQTNYQDTSVLSALANMDSEHELVKQAKLHGGDAIIFLGQNSQVTGYNGTYSGGYYGGSVSATANTMSQKGVAVIKYLPASPVPASGS
jgi:hypothetical protein